MDLLNQIKNHLTPARYKLPQLMWNSLSLNSRIRFHSFFRHTHNLPQDEASALAEYKFSKDHLKHYFATAIKYTLLSFHFKKKKNEIIHKLSSHQIILLKSFSYSASIKHDQFKDPFFLSFVERMASEKNHLLVTDPLMSLEETKHLLKVTNLNILPWFVFLNLSDFLKVLFFQLTQYFFFQKKSPDSWDKELKQEILHPTTFHHLLFHYAFKRIMKTFEVKRFITTFENNSWEKVVMQTFRENSPQTIIVGYQHSVVPESTLGMRFLPWEIEQKNLPDIIYTTGLETQNILRSFNPGLKIPIQALCALRYEYLYSMENKRTPLNKTLLVALEAILEASDLINIVLELKDYLVSHKFQVTFRFHPAMTYDFFKTIVDASKLESFATVSTNPLAQDLNHHDCVFYWGSTVSLESSFIGNALVNYQSSFPLSHDPLYLCNHLKYVVKNSNDLKKSLEDLYKLDLNFVNSEREAAQNYIKNYFHRPTPDHLNTLLGSSL